MTEAIEQQEMNNISEKPYLEDAVEIGMFYEERIKGGGRLTWNCL
ncbi:hypothetical protein [Brevibacillus laterosporus]|nr:hypothetical protein [Brevibacillus laterosporus]